MKLMLNILMCNMHFDVSLCSITKLEQHGACKMCEPATSMVLLYMKIKRFVRHFPKEEGNTINLLKHLHVRIKHGIDIKPMLHVQCIETESRKRRLCKFLCYYESSRMILFYNINQILNIYQ